MDLRLLSQEDIRFFRKEGYIIVHNVYDRNQLNEARQILLKAFDEKLWEKSEYDSPTIINDIYRLFPGLIEIVFNQNYFDAVKDILNDNAMWIPECAIHYNRYIDWHKDTTEQEIGGITSHYNPNAMILQCATYFQENCKGGGLTVIPGTHNNKDPFLLYYKKTKFHRAIAKVLKSINLSVFNILNWQRGKIDLPTMSGDLLIFDVRLNHKSTPSSTTLTGVHQDKLAIFNTFINESKAGLDYFRYMKNRPEPYYKFFNTVPLSPVVYKKAEELNMKIIY